jgi:phytanoyl-CoA hydroxylase
LYDSILNPSQQLQAPRLSSAVRAIIYHRVVSDLLSKLYPLHRDFISWQDMLFDRSTGTVDHLDSWYLDTETDGGLVGVWFALEDIQRSSGPFFVCPESHKMGALSKREVRSHSDFLSAVQSRIRDYGLQKVPMILRKGDLLAWNSLTIHGSFECENENLSRKSLTSHYYPLGCRRSDSLQLSDLVRDLRSLKTTSNPRIHRLSKFGRTPLFYALGGSLLAIGQKVGLALGDSWNMRRGK